MLASFFGVTQEHAKMEANPANDVNVREINSVERPEMQRGQQKSLPIAFSRSETERQHFPRLDSAPLTLTGRSPPSDFVDKDGHIWRAKFCVLEDGVLYFYRNASDGESTEARVERQTSTSLVDPQIFSQDLSQSPLPRKLIRSPGDTNGHDRDSLRIWEKRVSLNCVGAVRSSEQEYGRFAFELLALADEPEDDDFGSTTDSLILRAQNAQELNEWLFEFHRSIASFMKDIVDVMSYRGANLDHPVVAPETSIMSFSPGFQRQVSLGSSLSHGHGRSGLHRKRSPAKEEEPHISPHPGGDSGASFQFALESSEWTSPEEVRQIPIVSPSPVPSTTQHEPEIAGASCPETERPRPITPLHGKYVPPHLRKKQPNSNSKGRYVPPHLRNKKGNSKSEFLSLKERANAEPVQNPSIGGSLGLVEASAALATTAFPSRPRHSSWYLSSSTSSPAPTDHGQQNNPLLLGGCADPSLAEGSILDSTYKKRLSSKVGKSPPLAYGCGGGGKPGSSPSALSWEVGAISECGIRDSNEDAFLVCGDLIKAFESLHPSDTAVPTWFAENSHQPGFFGIFDGHCGNEAARFSAERLTHFLYDELKANGVSGAPIETRLGHMLMRAVTNLDRQFCEICAEDGRNWESGSTAMVAALVHNHLVMANLGDCRAVMCRSVQDPDDTDKERTLVNDGWMKADHEDEGNSRSDGMKRREYYWQEVAGVHTPSRMDERKRIESANGWITTEKEIPIAQLQRMDFCDEDVVEILKRCFSDRYEQSQAKKCNAAPQRILQISRVCGELAVSRAIGDRDFKAAFNPSSESSDGMVWDCPLFLPYPESHGRQFKGDLISPIPEIRTVPVSPKGYVDEFLVLACDGLWDVIDPDDAVRVTRGLLLGKKWSARKAAERLAELAIHLGSSDNITIVVISLKNEM